MNRIFLAGLMMTLMGCTTASPKQFYRPANSESQLEISGRFNQISFEHQVLINGETVIQGDLPYNYDAFSFSGTYQGRTVSSDCQWKKKVDLSCLVSIDGEKAATLTF
ncbi:hypothetical protein [Methylophaga sp.]|uniref:hypothetical protein n=1 Tax=Methylophaga sp. TaxID=2024840 RepID=UPI0013FEED1D|nr:hypothetical protein [Methylophaga sp.]MTI63905.1 hypothetical protein [Methylophaga sp.]